MYEEGLGVWLHLRVGWAGWVADSESDMTIGGGKGAVLFTPWLGILVEVVLVLGVLLGLLDVDELSLLLDVGRASVLVLLVVELVVLWAIVEVGVLLLFCEVFLERYRLIWPCRITWSLGSRSFHPRNSESKLKFTLHPFSSRFSNKHAA